MNKWLDAARQAGQKVKEAAESAAAQKTVQQAKQVTGTVGLTSLGLGYLGAQYAAKTVRRTYTGLAGFKESRDLAAEAQERYEAALEDFSLHGEAVKERIQKFEVCQRLALATSVARFVELWERQQKNVKLREHDFQVRLQLTPTDVAAFKAIQVTSLELAGGAGKAAIAGAGAGMAAVSLATSFGAASTGAAISSLSGAAAHSALLAWFGGGAVAAGGGGMALGTLVLGGIFVLPAVAVGAMAAAHNGEVRRTQAQEYAAQVDVAVENMGHGLNAIQAATQRMDELQDVIERLDAVLLNQVKRCEALERSGQTGGVHEDGFLDVIFQAYSSCVALTQVLRVPVVDEAFQVTAASGVTLEAARATLRSEG